MNLFDLFTRSSSKRVVDELEADKRPKRSKLFRIVSSISILGFFASIGILVLGIFGVLGFTPATFGAIGTIASVCIGSWLMLPWTAYFDQNKYKKVAIAFVCMDIAVPLLWIFAIWFLVLKITAGTAGAGTLTFIKVVMLISLQFSVVSLIANTILRYGKRLLIIQIIAYVSYLYFDFYLSYALFCISFNNTDGVVFSEALSVLGDRLMVALFVLALIYVIVAFSLINRRHSRRRRRTVTDAMIDEMLPEDHSVRQAPVAEREHTTEAQLQELQKLLDKNLITREEYEEKRKAIINRM